MGSLSYNVELEGGYQWKVHVNHLIRQPLAGVLVSPELVPVVTGEVPLGLEFPLSPPSPQKS